MGSKGDRANKEPLARQLYVSAGKSLEDIAEILDISRQTLSKWKADNGDEWDEARGRRGSRLERLRRMFDEMLDELDQLHASKRDSRMMDALSKLGALLQRMEESEATAQERSRTYRASLFLDFVRDIIEYSTKNDPALLAALEDNFDDLITWGREKHGDQ